ncbi:hypothetical protein [Streptomyces sp. KL118A]|uniref:hypothetical protein n=1 Tax=Streptomyces sp. KL118A TaxID=3045153 RepID=UPI00278C0FFC|nr:hypothetical protein [Streptomyces sp. KL118A]
MGQTVRIEALPHARNYDAGRAVPVEALFSLTMETRRLEGSYQAVGDAACAVLATVGVPAWLVKHMGDATRVAAHYVIGHSTAPSYRLHVTVDSTSIDIVVTDYDDRPVAGAPAWLQVGRDNTLQAPGLPPGTDSLTGEPGVTDGLRLHRTPDGHVRLGCRTSWYGPADG